MAGGAQQVVERRQRFDDEEDLIREQPAGDADAHFVDAGQQTAGATATERQRERTRDAARLDDAEAALLEEPAERLEREQPGMRQIEDPALAVVELTGEQHQAIDDES